VTRKYSSISVETTLQTGIGSGDTTITAPSSSAVTLLLGGVSLAAGNVDQFTVVIDPDTANEEILFVTGVSGANMTVVRARAGTAAVAHTAGAVIRHSLTSDDLTYYTTGVDSAATAAGTLTFTNKTIALGSNSVSGTTAQFNTALTDNDFATLAGTETLTNKTLTTPVASIAINAQTTALYGIFESLRSDSADVRLIRPGSRNESNLYEAPRTTTSYADDGNPVTDAKSSPLSVRTVGSLV